MLMMRGLDVVPATKPGSPGSGGPGGRGVELDKGSGDGDMLEATLAVEFADPDAEADGVTSWFDDGV
jgi:hypothetical protein